MNLFRTADNAQQRNRLARKWLNQSKKNQNQNKQLFLKSRIWINTKNRKKFKDHFPSNNHSSNNISKQVYHKMNCSKIYNRMDPKPTTVMSRQPMI